MKLKTQTETERHRSHAKVHCKLDFSLEFWNVLILLEATTMGQGYFNILQPFSAPTANYFPLSSFSWLDWTDSSSVRKSTQFVFLNYGIHSLGENWLNQVVVRMIIHRYFTECWWYLKPTSVRGICEKLDYVCTIPDCIGWLLTELNYHRKNLKGKPFSSPP